MRGPVLFKKPNHRYVGWILAVLVNLIGLLVHVVAISMLSAPPYELTGFVPGATAGLTVGILQWLLLRAHVRGAIVLIVVNTLSWSTGLGLMWNSLYWAYVGNAGSTLLGHQFGAAAGGNQML